MMNRSEIDSLLMRNNRAVEVGIYRIYQLQTADEKKVGVTKHSNNVGFAKSHANVGTRIARWVEKGNSLHGYYLDLARSICLRYSRQLTAIANNQIHVPELPKSMARKRPV